VKSGGSFLKDLRILNCDLRRTILVDNSPIAYSLQEENGMPILTWMDDRTDTALRDLIPTLLAMRAMDDVRPLLYRRHILTRMEELKRGTIGGPLARSLSPLPASPPQVSPISTLVEDDEADEEGVTCDKMNRINAAAALHRRTASNANNITLDSR
jgi:hypothetical protein